MLPSENELKERYASYSNNRLLGIIHCREEYTAEAIKVARAELAARNISAREVDTFLDEREAQRFATNALSEIPLTLWEKALFFFVWFAPWFIAGPLRLNYHEDGLTLKHQQSKVFAMAGFISLILDGIISVYFDLGSVSGLAILLLFFLLFQWLERKYSV